MHIETDSAKKANVVYIECYIAPKERISRMQCIFGLTHDIIQNTQHRNVKQNGERTININQKSRFRVSRAVNKKH